MPVQTAEADCGLNHPSFVSCLLRGGSYLDILGRTERAKKTGVMERRILESIGIPDPYRSDVEEDQPLAETRL
jgi:hypothetical protein